MLCDDIIADPFLPELYDGLDKAVDKIRRAQKFVLSREFTLAADGLVDNVGELAKIAPYCRTPFPLAWFEWAHRDRPHWDVEGPHKARPIDRQRHQREPHRIGILLEQLHERASLWLTSLFWSLSEVAPDLQSSHNASIVAIQFDAENAKGDDPLVNAVKNRSSDFGLGMLGGLMATAPQVALRLAEYAIEDWGGEVRFMIAALGLLNTRNVVEMQRIDNEKMNVKRQRHGKRPLFSHNIIKVRPSIVVWRNAGNSESGHRDLRLHFVQGHFKRRKSGMFWWSMHTRGNIASGMVSKDYELEGER